MTDVMIGKHFVIDKKLLFELIGYSPHAGQLQVHNSTARYRVNVAGRRWGKSLSAGAEAIPEILHPGHSGNRGTRGAVVSKNYGLCWKVFREIYAFMRKLGHKPVKKSLDGPYLLEYEWGSVVDGKSADHPDSLIGEGYDWLIFDECAAGKARVWEQYLSPTLTDRHGWALFISTPRGYNWFYDLYQRGKDPAFADWESFHFPSRTNPYLSEADIEEQRRILTHSIFMQEYEASFTTTAGQVYDIFDESVHVKPEKELEIEKGWKRYRAIDFGFENPFVCLWITKDVEDRVIVYDEYYKNRKSLNSHIRHLVTSKKAKSKKRPLVYRLGAGGKIEEVQHPERPRLDVKNKYVPAFDTKTTKYDFTICDVNGKSQRKGLEEAGIAPIIAFKQDVDNGLENVRKRLEVREDGTPGLYVSDRCRDLITEFNLYTYPDTGIDEKPVEEYDHGLDALRYFCVYDKRGQAKQVQPRR